MSVTPKSYDRATHPQQYDEIRKWTENFHAHDDSLCLIGATGTGKTHLAVAFSKFIPLCVVRSRDYRNMPELRYRAARIYFQDYSEMQVYLTSNPGDKERYIKSIAMNFDCLILDDLKFENLTDAKLENLSLLINRVYNYKRKIIITANVPEELFGEIDDRVYSRLSEICIWIKFLGQDYRKTFKRRNQNGIR